MIGYNIHITYYNYWGVFGKDDLESELDLCQSRQQLPLAQEPLFRMAEVEHMASSGGEHDMEHSGTRCSEFHTQFSRFQQEDVSQNGTPCGFPDSTQFVKQKTSICPFGVLLFRSSVCCAHLEHVCRMLQKAILTGRWSGAGLWEAETKNMNILLPKLWRNKA